MWYNKAIHSNRKGDCGMLQLVFGRAGSGKTQYARELLCSLAKQGGQGLILLVPEQFSFESERAILHMLGPKEAALVEVLSFTRLADSFRRAYGGVCGECIDDAGRALTMSLALESVWEQLELYSRNRDTAHLVSELLSVSTQCKQACIAPDALLEASVQMEDGLLKKKTREIALILASYEALVAGRFTDMLDEPQRLYEGLKIHPYFQGKTIVVDAFKSFTAQERRVLSLAIEQAKEVIVTLCAQGLPTPADAGTRFALTARTAGRLVRDARRAGVQVRPPVYLTQQHRFASQALAVLEEGLFEPGAAVYAQAAPEVTVYSAQSRYGECDFTAREIKRLLREEAYRCREIAVIMRDEQAYTGPLAAAFTRYGVPVFEDKRSPVMTQPLMLLVRAALEIAANGFRTQTLMRYLKTGLTGITREEIAQLENYAILWQIDYSGWIKPFERHPRGMETEFTENDIHLLERINSVRKKAVAPLLRLRKAVGDTDGQGIAAAVYDLLAKTGVQKSLLAFALALEEEGEVQLALEQERVWDMLMELLNASAVILGDRKTAVKNYAALLDTMLSMQEIGSIPQGLDEITVGSAERVRVNSPRAVFLLGVNEGVFPAAVQEGGLFTDKERRVLQEAGLELGDPCEDKAVEERFVAYNSASAARERLYLTYALADEIGNLLRPSVLAAQCMRLVPQCRRLSQGGEPFLSMVESGKSALSLYAQHIGDSSEYESALAAYLACSPAYQGTVRAIRRAALEEPFSIEDGAAAVTLFGRDMYISASRAEAYYACPFQYFCRYGLNAKPRAIAQLDALQSGTVIHYILEQMLREHGAGGLAALTPPQRLACIERHLLYYRDAYLGGEQVMTQRDKYTFGRLARTVFSLIERLAQEFAHCKFEPVDFELNIDRDGEIDPYCVTLDDGSQVRVRGKVDRVDLLRTPQGSMVRIVDYKSGIKKFRLCDVLSGLNIQMILYLMCIEKNGAQRYGQGITPAGVLYLSAREPSPSLPRDASQEAVEKARTAAYRMSGMVLGDPDVILAMEDTGGGVFIPASVTPDGAPAGNIISAREYTRLTQKVDELLRQMAQGLHRGNIAALPAENAEYQQTCLYCDYGDICRRTKDAPVRKTPDLKHDKSRELLEGDADAKVD